MTATIELDEHEPISITWNARHEPAVNKFFNSNFLAAKLKEDAS
jgi:hypothetical protein